MPRSRSDRLRSHSPIRWRVGAIGAFLPILVLALAACGAGSAAQPAGQPGDELQEPDTGAGDRDGNGVVAPGDDLSGGDEGGIAYEDLANRQIVKTGEITIEVESVSSSVGAVRAMALQLGGYVGGSQAGTTEDAATLTLRIPAARFDDAIEQLHELDGDVTAEATREQDVTGSVVDLEARIRNLDASEDQYRSLLDRATDIEDILTIQSRLDEVRGQIEQMQAQLDQLSELASLATLTVTLVPAAAPVEEAAAAWDPGKILDNAVAALVGLGQAVAAAAIWLVILGLPLAVVLGILVWIGLRVTPLARRRPSASEHPGAAGE